jgi:hypothetical protein
VAGLPPGMSAIVLVNLDKIDHEELDKIDREELRELITDFWLIKAPSKLRHEFEAQ